MTPPPFYDRQSSGANFSFWTSRENINRKLGQKMISLFHETGSSSRVIPKRLSPHLIYIFLKFKKIKRTYLLLTLHSIVFDSCDICEFVNERLKYFSVTLQYMNN